MVASAARAETRKEAPNVTERVADELAVSDGARVTDGWVTLAELGPPGYCVGDPAPAEDELVPFNLSALR